MEVSNRATFMRKYDNGGYSIHDSAGDGKIGGEEIVRGAGIDFISTGAAKIIHTFSGGRFDNPLNNITGQAMNVFLSDAERAGLSIKEVRILTR